MKLKSHDVVLVVGIRGAGKSYWIERHIVRKQKRVVVWDPHAEYKTQERKTLDELVQDANILDREALSLSVVPAWRRTSEVAEQFEIFTDLCASAEGLTIVVEETGLLRHASESVECMACQSRHWDSPLVLCAQRAVQVPKTAREQLSHVVSFRQSSPDDVEALVERCGDGANKVRTLPRREFWQWCEEDSFEVVRSSNDEEKGEEES
jgi:hypothetical protein